MNINKLFGEFELVYITSSFKPCICDNCTAYIQNIAIIKRVNSGNKKDYRVGLDCCKKLTFSNKREAKHKLKIWNACQRFIRAFEAGNKPELLAFGVIQIVDLALKSVVRVDYNDLITAFPAVKLPDCILNYIQP